MSGSGKVRRTCTVRFGSRPNLLQLQRELEHAAKYMPHFVAVVVETNGSASPELEEITLTMEDEG